MNFKIKEPKNPKEIIWTGNNYYTFCEDNFINVEAEDNEFFKADKRFVTDESEIKKKFKKGSED